MGEKERKQCYSFDIFRNLFQSAAWCSVVSVQCYTYEILSSQIIRTFMIFMTFLVGLVQNLGARLK